MLTCVENNLELDAAIYNESSVILSYADMTPTEIHCSQALYGLERWLTIGGLLLSFLSILKHLDGLESRQTNIFGDFYMGYLFITHKIPQDFHYKSLNMFLIAYTKAYFLLKVKI